MAQHVSVAPSIVNDNPKQWIGVGAHFPQNMTGLAAGRAVPQEEIGFAGAAAEVADA